MQPNYNPEQYIQDAPINQPGPGSGAPDPSGSLTQAQLNSMSREQVRQAVRGRVPSVAELRAMTRGDSEDFGRFSDAEVQAMLDTGLYDVNVQKFRTSKTDQNGNPIEGWVDKPDDVPDGWEAWGQTMARRTGEGGSAAAAAPAAPEATTDPGQRYLEDMLAQQGGLFSSGGRGNQGAAGSSLAGGGIWWNPGAGAGSAAPVPFPEATTNPDRRPQTISGMPAVPAMSGALSQAFGPSPRAEAPQSPTSGPSSSPLASAVANAYRPRSGQGRQWWQI